jgi:hypothetical protein
MNNEPHISYKLLLEVTSWGIFAMKMKGKSVSDERIKKLCKVKNAVYGGIYVGSPGKDIYLMLPYLSDKQMKEVVLIMVQNFPKIPPRTYVNIAACIRFIYGQFEKQGILKSNKDFERMKNEKLDWILSRKFLKMLEMEFKKNNNYYGLDILCEMEAHRLGDEAVIKRDEKILKNMEEKYNKSVKYANKCKSYKHMFSIYYWMGEYFKKFGKIEKAVKYFKLSIANASKYYCKYFPQGEQYYSKRLSDSFKYIKDNDKIDYKEFSKKYKNSIKNKFKKGRI